MPNLVVLCTQCMDLLKYSHTNGMHIQQEIGMKNLCSQLILGE